MANAERKIVDNKKIEDIARRCSHVSVAFVGENCPYVVPLNFGMLVEGDEKTLYFHGAKKGQKMEFLKINNNVSFCMVASTELKLDDVACKSTMYFESVCGKGKAYVVDGDEKLVALGRIMQQYKVGEKYNFDSKMVSAVAVWKIVVCEWQGKSNIYN